MGWLVGGVGGLLSARVSTHNAAPDNPQEVIQAFGAQNLPGYFALEPLTDAAGFSIKRPYPAGTPPALVVTGNGAPYAACVMQVHVDEPQTPNGMSRLHAWLFERCQSRHRVMMFHAHAFTDPEFPTEVTFYQFKAAPKPQQVSLTAEFFYDYGDGKFYGPQGQLTGPQILAFLYDAHC